MENSSPDNEQEKIEKLIDEGVDLILKQKPTNACETFEKAYDFSTDFPTFIPKILAKHVLAYHLTALENQKFFKEFKQKYDKIQNFDEVWKNTLSVMYDDIKTLHIKIMRFIKPFFYAEVGIFTLINQKFTSSEEIPYDLVEIIIGIFANAKSNLSRSIKNEFGPAALNRIITFCENHFNEKLRKIDENRLRYDIDAIKDLLSSSDNKRLQQFEKTITFKFATSHILSKKFDALQRFNQNKSFSKDLVQEINNAGIVPNMMLEMHQDLAAPFSQFLLKLWDAGAYDVKVLNDFWQISINSLQSVIGKFFDAWPPLFYNLPKGKNSDFWDIVATSKTYPPAALSFLEKIASTADEATRSRMVDSLWAASGDDKIAFVGALTAYVQGSNAPVKKMMENCFKSISESKDVEFSLLLLQKIWTPKASDNIRRDFDVILEKTQIDPAKSAPFLSALVKIASALNDPFNDKEISEIERQLAPIYDNNYDTFKRFFKTIIPLQKSKIIPKNSVGGVIGWLSGLPKAEDNAFAVITFVFEIENGIEQGETISSLDLVGMNELWEFFFKSKSSVVAEYVVDLVIRCSKSDTVSTFVNNCLSRGFTKSTMHALCLLISKFEDSIDREALGIRRNMYFVSTSQTKKDENSKQYKKEELPSQVIKTPKNMKDLFKILDSNDPELAVAALNLLNFLETDPEEINLLRSDKVKWNELLSMEKPYRLFYRLNTFGNILTENSKAFILKVFSTGGFRQFMEILQCGGRNLFKEDRFLKLFLTIVTQLIVRCYTVEDAMVLKNKVYKDVGVPQITANMIPWILELIKHKSVTVPGMLAVMRDIVQLEPNDLLGDSRLPELFSKLAFNSDENISKGFSAILMDFPTEKVENILISNINLSKNGNCANYYTVLEKVTSETKNIETLWKTLVDTLLNGVFIQSSKKLDLSHLKETDHNEDPSKEYKGDDEKIIELRNLKRRKFTTEELEEGAKYTVSKVADASFIAGIYSCLLKLAGRFDHNQKIPKSKTLIDFSLTRIALNPYRFVAAPNYLFDLIILLLKKDKSMIDKTVKIIIKAIQMYDTTKEGPKYMSQLSLNPTVRGLNNMGCTCYLNSSLQQIFRLRHIRDELLKYDPSGNITEDWTAQLQLLFAKLLYFPMSAIDAVNFVKTFKIMKKAINPLEQMDAQEFIVSLFDNIDEVLQSKPVAAETTGELQHDTVSTMPDKPWKGTTYEKFTTLTFEVLGQNNYEDSFKILQKPDEFTGENGYRTEDIGMIDAERYHSISKPPNTLIIQLKRFEFDFSTLTKKKIYSEYKFPLTMDISPLLSKDSTNQNAVYELRGIIIHSGSANGGHYYSYIRNPNNTWIECNDSTIYDIQEDYAMSSSFGGVNKQQGKGQKPTEKMNSAYMLVYKLSGHSDNSKEEIEPLSLMPAVMLDTFIQENMMAIYRTVLFSDNFMNFVHGLISFNNLEADKMQHLFLDKACYSMSGERYINALTHSVCQRVNSSQEFARYCMKRALDIHLTVILESTNYNTRNTWANVLSATVNSLKMESQPIIDNIYSKFVKVLDYWRNFDQIFYPLLSYAYNVEGADFMGLSEKLLKLLDKQFLEAFSSNLDNVLNEINVSTVFRILKHCIVSGNLQKKFEDAIISNEKFMNTWFSSPNSVFDFASLICVLMKDNKEQTQKYFDIVTKSKERISTISLASHIANALSFEDSLTMERVNFFFGLLGKKDYDETMLTQLFRLINNRIAANRGVAMQSLMSCREKWLDENLKSQDPRLRSTVSCLLKNLFVNPPMWKSREQNSSILYPPENTKSEPDEKEQKFLNEFLEFMIKMVPTMDSFYKAASKNSDLTHGTAVQSQEFYDLLSWTVYSGNLFEKVNEHRDLFLNSAKVLMKYGDPVKMSIFDVLRFITIASKGNPDFFTPKFLEKLITTIDKIPEPGIDYVSQMTKDFFPALIPIATANYSIIVRSKIFLESLSICLGTKYGADANVQALFEEIMKEEKAIEPLAKIFFAPYLFKYHFKEKTVRYFVLAKMLFIKGPAPVDIFFKEKHYETVFSELDWIASEMKKSHKPPTTFFPVVELLVAFNRAFSSFKPTKTLLSDPEDKLSNYYISMKDTFFFLSNEIQGSTATQKFADTVIDLYSSIFLNHKALYRAAASLFDSTAFSKLPRDSLSLFAEFRGNLYLLLALEKVKESAQMVAKDFAEMSKLTLNVTVVGHYAKLVDQLLTRLGKDNKELALAATNFFNSFLISTQDSLAFHGVISRAALASAEICGRIGDASNWIASCLKLMMPVVEDIGAGDFTNLSLKIRQIVSAKTFINEAYTTLKINNPKIPSVSPAAPKSALKAIEGKPEDYTILKQALEYFCSIFTKKEE